MPASGNLYTEEVAFCYQEPVNNVSFDQDTITPLPMCSFPENFANPEKAKQIDYCQVSVLHFLLKPEIRFSIKGRLSLGVWSEQMLWLYGILNSWHKLVNIRCLLLLTSNVFLTDTVSTFHSLGSFFAVLLVRRFIFFFQTPLFRVSL